MKRESLLSRPLEVAAVGESGLSERVEATAAERAAIAAEHGLIAVDSLAADLSVGRLGGLIAVEGRLVARVVHTCVISLRPAPQEIDEPLRATFALAGTKQAPVTPKPGAEIMVDPEIDEPELLVEPRIDLGVVVLEHFSLALDPYPRAPGAELPAAPEAGDESAAESPFAALAGLASGRKGRSRPR